MEQGLIETSAADPAATAFDGLRREVTMLRLAVAQLADAPAKNEPLDYTETLGAMANGITKTAEGLKALRSSPALELTPDELSRQIVRASAEMREVEREGMRRAAESLRSAAGELSRWIDTARLASVQNPRLIQTGAAAFVRGVLLWSMLPGIISRAVPASWHWPERMAARTMRVEMWQADQPMMTVADHNRWESTVAILQRKAPHNCAVLPSKSTKRR